MKTNLLPSLALALSALSSGHLTAARAAESSGDQPKVVAGNTAFALDLYGRLRGQGGNLCFSPYSISTALAMTYAGARGETATQMAQTLHFDLPPNRLHPAFAGLMADFAAEQEKGQVQLAEANSLWPQKGFAFLPDYLALCRKDYGTAIEPVDYENHAEGARKTINDWVSARTSGKITDLLKPGTLDAADRLVLVDAIYFKGKWESPFEGRSTEGRPFYVSPDKRVMAPTMNQTHNFRYAEFPDLQVLELPYVGGDLSMLVLLPRGADELEKLEAELTAEKLAAWTTNLQDQKVRVLLPQLKMTSEFALAKTLENMGMPDAFNFERADFSGMDGRKDLFISAVAHKAFVEVNEQGAEAAAATAVTMTKEAAVVQVGVPLFDADHPFLFLIRDNRNGSILFLGRVSDPTQAD